MYEGIRKSNLSSTVATFDSVPPSSPFGRLVKFLTHKSNMGRLGKKIRRWFNETSGSGKDFQYRFTGQDSRLFLHHFMEIIDSIVQPSDSVRETFSLHVFAYLSLQLRQIFSIVSRVVNISLQEIKELQQHCSNLFRAVCMFATVSPTFWTIGHIVPAHALDVFQKYNLGLNAVSMEGREAKHMAIKRYNQNTTYAGRWTQIFWHEFVQMI